MGKQIGAWHQYSGVIHVHTTESDGTKTIEEVVAIGQAVDVDFMMFTDHMTLSNKENGKEGLYDRTLVTVGYEHNDPEDNNHYLLFESPHVYPREMTVGQYVAAGAADGSFGIIAHPDEIRDRNGKYPPYPWTDWTARGFQGIELWNQMSEWMERLSPYNKLFMALSPRKSMVGPTDRVLKIWDDFNAHTKCVGVASVDAHAFPVKLWPTTVEIFPYKVHFRSLRTYILLPEPMSDNFETAKRQLFEALADCRVFFANLRWGNPDGFEFYAANGSERVIAGGKLYDLKKAKIHVRIPSRSTVSLVRNGKTVLRFTGRRLDYPINEPGLYRVETRKWGRGWIYSNHIRVGV